MMNREHAGHEIMHLARDWTAAELRGDIAFLQMVLSDDFIGIGPLGFMLTKQEWLARHQSGDLKYQSLDLDEVTVRIYNEAAVLIGRQTQAATYRGSAITAQLRTTLVLVQNQEQWWLASLHFSSIGQPPSFTQSSPITPNA
jgi:ketosteroid isomerase-like protein